MAKIRIVVADIEEIFREGLAKLLEGDPTLEVVATCYPKLESIRNFREWQPDVILLHGILLVGDGFELMQCIRAEQLKSKVIVLTHSRSDKHFAPTIRAGAKAYLSKDISIDNLIKTITLVAEGNVVVSPLMATKLLQEFDNLEESKGTEKLTTLLSQREREVLSLVAQGLTNKEIAVNLSISDNTVKVHLRNIMDKLNVHNRHQAVTILGGNQITEVASAYTRQA